MPAPGAYRRNILHDVLDKHDATLIPFLPPRAGIATVCIVEDSLAINRGIGAADMQKVLDASTKDTPDVVIGRFWNDPNNKTIVDSFMNNKLCINAAKGDRDALEAFKKYAVQDYFYLVDWVGFRALRFATLPHDDFNLDALDNELASVSRTTSYVKDWFQTCINNLGVTESQFKVERSIAEIAYAQFLQNNARSDDWYNLHVILIGCYWAWCKLALKLYNDPTTDKTTTFYKYWIQANLDLTNPNQPDFTSSAKALSLFLDQNESAWSSSQSRTQATDLFRSALRLEVALFDSGYETPTPRVQ